MDINPKKLTAIILVVVFLVPSAAILVFTGNFELAALPLLASVYALAGGLGKAFEAGGNSAQMTNELKDMYEEDNEKPNN